MAATTTAVPRPSSLSLTRYIWPTIFWVLMACGAYATYLRFFEGLGAVTNLSDAFPWGIWIGFDILCGVGLAAGGFTLVAIVHIFNIESFKPMLRPAILTAFLGYVLVVFALMFDLGRPDRIWHAMIMWNPHSVMFEVAWCVMLYSTVLFLEFLPAVFEKFGWQAPLKLIHSISVPLMILGVVLSTLHQSSLGTLFLIVPHKLHPLWYTPLMPLFFYLSAISVGLAMTIFESWHSSKAFGRQLELPLLQKLARILAVLLSTYLMLRFTDLSRRGALPYLRQGSTESWLFLLEIALLATPAILLFQERVRVSPRLLYFSAALAIFGFITNRLNISVTGIEAESGVQYMPKWTEVTVTLAICALGFGVFRWIARNFPVFEEEEGEAQAHHRT
jgi:Ni/Fe-hydrogenase subunit HybB-like protein